MVWDEKARLTKEKRRQKRKEYILEKKNVPCQDCGGTFPSCCMDFHHLGESTKHPHGMRKGFLDKMANLSIKKIDEEISKCVVICSNCHRIRHHEG